MPAPFSLTTRALARDAGNPALLAWGVAALLLTAWTAWLLLGRVTVWEVSHQARLEAALGAHAITVRLPSRILSSQLVVGASVQAGQVLVELDSTGEQLQLREAQARLAALAPQIEALQGEIATLGQAGAQDQQARQEARQAASARLTESQAGVGFATDLARRLTAESEAGGVAVVDALQAQSQRQKLTAAQEALTADARRQDAEAQARGLQQRAQALALRRQLAAQQGEQAGLRQAIAQLDTTIDKHRLRAPVAGRIGDVAPLRPGEVVAAGQRLATVVPPGALTVVADFDPAAVLGRLHPGQPAQLKLHGFPWAQHGSLAVTVSRVADEVREQRIRVEFTPRPPWPTGVPLQHGLPGTVEVAVDEVSPAQLVLRAAGQRLSTPPAAVAPLPVALAGTR